MSDFTGSWNVSISTPMGKQEGVLSLTQDGSSVSGTMAASGESVEIENGNVDGGSATWDVKVSKPMPMTLNFSAEKSGDDIKGSVKLGAFGDAPFEGSPA